MHKNAATTEVISKLVGPLPFACRNATENSHDFHQASYIWRSSQQVGHRSGPCEVGETRVTYHIPVPLSIPRRGGQKEPCRCLLASEVESHTTQVGRSCDIGWVPPQIGERQLGSVARCSDYARSLRFSKMFNTFEWGLESLWSGWTSSL